ncbi:DNA gyrase inhibitor YacG [Pararhodospirillum oryzae]|uniref:DNA gyrase inhibitor YacG n=1 Tax=Pararhodospirillum oryzae TaxID=478448 RepID=A0A512H9U5_9PROT|nr:DNA gyrase inhibitor YacG [Pararhodospirillum oryzae]GEO82219.1 hypothetical protein ROR02_23500 [Pararhodospirillum oryzae]
MEDADETPAVRLPKAACPLCGRPVDPRYRPFCSRTCADRDLGHWLSGRYRIPTDETPASESDEF